MEWYAGSTHESSFAETFAPASHWELTDLVAVVTRAPKGTGSTQGHTSAASSVLQQARLDSAPERLARCREAILGRDFASLAQVAELDAALLHAVMMTSTRPLLTRTPVP